jgi:hypothetical protein
MNDLRILYKFFIRLLYKKHQKNRNTAADNLGFILILFNSFSIVIFSEILFNYEGIGYYLKNRNSSFPLIALTPLIVIIWSIIESLLKKITFKQKRDSFITIRNTHRIFAQIYLIASVIIFCTSFYAIVLNF